MSDVLDPIPDQDLDLTKLPWVYETGEDAETVEGEVVGRYPYRTVFAIDPGSLDDRFPLADLDDDAGDEVGRLMACAPELARIGREVWQALDEVRCRDARWLGPKLRQLHRELGAIVARAEGARE